MFKFQPEFETMPRAKLAELQQSGAVATKTN